MPDLACFYSLSSPWAYFAGPRLAGTVARGGVRLALKPFDFQAVVPRTGGVPLRTRPEPRQAYHEAELARWSRRLGMPLNLRPRHYRRDGQPPDWNKRPGWTVIAAVLAGHDDAAVLALSQGLLAALWAGERDTADADVRRAVADEVGLDGAALVAAEGSEPVQAAYRANSAEALRLGVFGSPTFVVAGELFWGQDRLDFVEEVLADGGVPAHGPDRA